MFKTLRRYYWVTGMFIRRHLAIITRTTAIVLTAITVFFLFARYLPTPKQTVKIAKTGKFTVESIPSDIQAKISRGLVSLDDSGLPQPALAASWDVQDDGKLYTFYLTPNLHWSDGSPVVGSDLAYNFAEVETNATENTVTFRLKEPFSPFFFAVSRPVLKNNRLGVGEYRLTKTKVVNGVLQSLTIESDTVREIYKFYPTETAALTAYRLGEVNQVVDLSLVPPDMTKDNSTVVSADTHIPKIAAIFLNNNDSTLSSKSTRQGLAYAISDKSFGGTRALSPISKTSWAYNDLVKDYEFDAERAKTLFDQDVQTPEGVHLELKTMLPYLDIAEKIADDWRHNLKVQVDVKVVSGASSDYQMILADYAPPADPDQYTIWHSTQATNFTHYSSLKVDKLLEDGRRTNDPKLRKEIYQDFQRFLLEDCPTIFLFDTSSYALSRKSLI